MRKMTKWRKPLSLLLTLSMMFSLFSISAFAAEPDDADYVQEETIVEEVVTETEETEPEVPAVTEETEPEVPTETEETEPEVPAETEDETVDAEEPDEGEDPEESEDAEIENASGQLVTGGSIIVDPDLSGSLIGGGSLKPICKHPLTYTVNSNDGTHTGSCSICNTTKTEAHKNIKYTDNEDGTHTGICGVCGAPTEEDVGHTDLVYKANDDGLTHKVTCKSCMALVAENEEHTMEWVVTKEATCEEPGEKVLTCSACGFKGDTEEIDVLAAVAEVNGQKYPTLQAALDAVKAQYSDKANAQTEWTVKLVNNTIECVSIAVVPGPAKAMTLTIDLNGKTITGNGSGPVISVGELTSYAAPVQFIIADSMGTGTVTGGNSDRGGAIYVSSGHTSSKLIINGGNFTGNTAGNGGVISSNYQADVPVVINGGTFTGNTATENGGVVFARTVTINGGTFTGNTAGKGGAIYVVGTGWSADLTLKNAKVYGNKASEYGDDIVFGLTGSYNRATTLDLMNASAMVVAGVDTWLVDGYGLSGETGRVSDTNRVAFDLNEWPNTNKTGKALIALKAGLGHTHTAGEAVEENRVEATYEAPGSYDLATYCEVCGKEMSRETVTIAQLVPAPVTPVTPVDPGNGSSATGSTTSTPTETTNNDNDTPAAPTTPDDPEPEDDDDEIDEQDIPMAAAEAAPAETEPEAAEPEADEEPVTIDEEDTPLATIGESGTKGWSLLNLVLALVTVLMSLMMLASYFKAKSNVNLVSVIPAVFAVVTFMVTSNLSGSMAFADSWTPAMLLYTALNAGVVALAMKKRKENA